MGKLIDRYLAKHLLFAFFLLLTAFVCIYLIFDFFEKIDNFSEAHVKGTLILTYFLCALPGIISQMLPAAFFLAGLISLSILKKHNELIALQASGLSPYRLGLPYLVLGILISVGLFSFNEFIVPKTQAISSEIWNVKVEKKETRGGYIQERIWLRGKNSIYQIDMVDLKHNVLRGVTIYFFSPDFRLERRIDAQKAVWDEKRSTWIFYQGVEETVGSQGKIKTTYFHQKVLHFKETPKDFCFLQMNYQELNIWKLKRYVDQLKRQGYDATPYQVDLWQRTAMPLTPFILILLGLGLIFKEKEVKITHTIALGIFIAFLFWVIQALFLALGKGGHLHPALAAWIPNVLFGLWGMLLLKYSGE